jgi:hypothetical protein
VELHLIKGIPAVHDDDDLIVCHIALDVDDMDGLRDRFREKGIAYRTNISVPNPTMKNTRVEQVREGRTTI